MLDLAFIRENTAKVKVAAANKRAQADIDGIIAADERRRGLLKEVEALRAERNEVSKKIGAMKRKGQEAPDLVGAMRHVGERIKTIEDDLAAVETQLAEMLLWVPNIPAEDVPVGPEETKNEIVRSWGEPKRFDKKPLPHWEVAEKLGLMDFARASKISGGGFMLYTGDGARLERALISFMLDLHTGKHGYREVLPPYLVNRDCMTGTGQLPKMEEDMYKTSADDLFLIPTAEVPVTNMYRGEILNGFDLPVKLTAYSGCFRREAGSYGKDTRGLIRVHQFDKVEMVKFTEPEKSYEELESLLRDAEEVLQALGLAYRVVKLSTEGISFAAAKCYDIEVWAAGVERWLEVSSCSNFESFQARRANIRYRDASGKVRFVHTLNGSGVALPRTVVAILENYQNADGSVTIPEALRPYFAGREKIGAGQ
jgi:seryl-tRNA synthetase